jgi:hypothetical protein
VSAPVVAAIIFAPLAVASAREFLRYHRAVEADRVRRMIDAAERDGRVAR